jgi:hypothetical protein
LREVLVASAISDDTAATATAETSVTSVTTAATVTTATARSLSLTAPDHGHEAKRQHTKESEQVPHDNLADPRGVLGNVGSADVVALYVIVHSLADFGRTFCIWGMGAASGA